MTWRTGASTVIGRRLIARSVTALLLVASVAACGGPSVGASSATGGADPPSTGLPEDGPVELQVYAAASLRNVLARLAAAYEAGRPGTALVVGTDASSALAAKIEQGAPADVFLSADTRNPQRLADAGLTAGGVTVFADNELALIVPAGNPAGISSPADLARAGLKVIAAADGVPIATYTSALLANLAGLDGYPADYAARVAANVVSREDNVGGIVAKVALGEGDAGLVYATDARAADGVVAIPIPEDRNVRASYGAVVVKDAVHAAAAADFLAWLTSADAQDILASFGFRPAA